MTESPVTLTSLTWMRKLGLRTLLLGKPEDDFLLMATESSRSERLSAVDFVAAPPLQLRPAPSLPPLGLWHWMVVPVWKIQEVTRPFSIQWLLRTRAISYINKSIELRQSYHASVFRTGFVNLLSIVNGTFPIWFWKKHLADFFWRQVLSCVLVFMNLLVRFLGVLWDLWCYNEPIVNLCGRY